MLAGGAFCTLALAHSLQTFTLQTDWNFVFCSIAVVSLTGAANLPVSASLAILADSTKTSRTHCSHDCTT